MILKSMEMQGFKSFPDRTRLEFNNGFTAVVGPNGCGKSNISDAIRWVLGEQSTKTLRGQKMEDIIFSGTQQRISQGFAKVELVFDNKDRRLDLDQQEVVVSRKLYRGGESEYLLNGKNVLLKDILALFMDTGLSKEGYSMIGQGKIEEIVSLKSLERRKIFDEAAGITKYRYRKKEAIKKLALANDNLLRLNDILEEIKGQIIPLKKQSIAAKKFNQLSNEKKKLDISIFTYEIKSIKEKIKNRDDKLYLATKSYKNEQDGIDKINSKLKESYDNIQTLNLEIERRREKNKALVNKISDRKTNQAVILSEINHAKSDISRIENEIESFNKADKGMKGELEGKKSEILNLNAIKGNKNKLKEELKNELLQFNMQKGGRALKYDELNAGLNESTLKKNELKLNIQMNKTRQQELEEQISSLKQQLAEQDEKSKEAQGRKQEALSSVDRINQKSVALKNTLGGYDLKISGKQTKLNELDNSLKELDKEIMRKNQKVKLLNELKKSMQGFSVSVKSVLKAKQNGILKGIEGTVASSITTKPKYALAVETALGAVLQNIVVKTEQNAKEAIEYLKQTKVGRATFLPLCSIKPNKLMRVPNECDGFIGVLNELVSYDVKYENIIQGFFTRTIVVDSMDNAISMAKKYGYKFKIVTLDGQIINAGGSFSGGYKSKQAGLLSRDSEIEKLKGEAINLENKRQQLDEQLNEINKDVLKLNALKQGIKSELLVCKEDIVRYESEIKGLDEILKNAKISIQDRQEQMSANEDKQRKCSDNLKQSAVELQKIDKDIKDYYKHIETLKSEQDEIRGKRDELEKKLHEFDMEIAEVQQSIKSVNTFIEDLIKRADQNVEKLDSLKSQIEDKHKVIELKTKQIEQQKVDSDEDDLKAREIESEINLMIDRKNEQEASRELAIKEEKEKIRSQEKFGREITKFEQQKKALELGVDDIIKKLWDEYEMGYTEAKKQAIDIEDIDESKMELTYLKNKIKALGNINLGAIEQYSELKQRYDFLNDQIKDATSSKEGLIKLISDLDRSMKRMFKDTFYKINKNFKEVFKELFEGGDADLRLDDENDVLECGIDIQVKPPGKIIKNLTALSGGEKAFVAIAIYFAILKVNPAPFCVLDEIEAALDDVNVTKFALYLKKMDKKTQFIVITHRRGTMEQADILYGVTMQEEGVSKLLKLDGDKVAAIV